MGLDAKDMRVFPELAPGQCDGNQSIAGFDFYLLSIK
jgi:hypothetical protein